jgi:hypothetical protein
MDDGYSYMNTKVVFTQDADVRIRKQFQVEKYAQVNPLDKDIRFFIGCEKYTGYNNDDDDDDDSDCSSGYYSKNSYCGSGKLDIHGYGVTFNGLVYVPGGQIHVHGANSSSKPIYMNGKFIAEKVHSQDKYVYWNWTNCGPVNAPRTQIADVEEEQTIVEESAGLEFNTYPNPVNSLMSIEFTAPTNGKALIEIYDINGAKIAEVYNQLVEAQMINTLNYDVSGLESGIYFIRITTNESTETKRFVKIQ